MTYAQLQFVKAEAAFRIGRQGDGAHGVPQRASRRTSTSSTRATSTTTRRPTQISATEKAAFLADTRIVPTTPAALTLTQIMTQKYIAQWGVGPQRAVDGHAPVSLHRHRSGDRRADLSRLRAADEPLSGQQRQDRAAHSAALQLRVRVELCRRSRPSAATCSTTTRSHSGSPNRNPSHDQNPNHCGAAGRRGCSRRARKDGVQNITAPTAGALRQVLQLRRERAGGELLRQRRQGDGDQLDELHAGRHASESRVHVDGHRSRRPAPRTAARATPDCIRRSRRPSTRSPGRIADRDRQRTRRREAFRRRSRTGSTTRSIRVGSTTRPPRRSTRSSSKIRFPTQIDFTTSYVRFVNASSNSNPDDAVREEHRRRATRWSSGRRSRTRAAGAFVPMPGGCTI